MSVPTTSMFHPEKLQERIGYFFNDIELLKEALTHRSYAHEHPEEDPKDNERLEFLGDAVVNLVLSDLLLRNFPYLSEGRLSKLRAGQVNEKTLASLGRRLGLGAFLRMGKGEDKTGGRNKNSLLADTLEALVGAVYWDGGFEAARSLVERLFHLSPQEVLTSSLDHKTLLQEYCQGKMKTTPSYRVAREEGPDHRKTFVVELSLRGRVLALGTGGNKKEAEQQAAAKAWQLLQSRDGGPAIPSTPARS